jgi:2,5-dihydroxypyridine 5,6-dioxygenase
MPGPSMIDAIQFATKVIRTHLELQSGEEVVIVGDTYTDRDIIDALAGAILGAGGEFTVVIHPARTRPEDQARITRSALRAYEGADVIIPMGGASGAVMYGASKVSWPLLADRKTRIFTLAEPSLSKLTQGAAAADYLQVEQIGLRIIGRLKGVDRLHVTTATGSDITFRIGGRDLINLASFARRPGEEGGIPSGEVTVDPVVGATEGVLVVDGPIGNVGRPSSPITLVAREGQWVEVRGESPEADKLRRIFDTIERSRNVAEFALGTNPWARRTGVVSEEKKRLGTMHTAFGRSTRSADWRCEVWSDIHGDVVVYAPTVTVEGEALMRDGTLIASGGALDDLQRCRGQTATEGA